METNAKGTEDSWKSLEYHKFNTIVASILSFIAGNVNSLSTISILFERSTHVSGRIADIGIDLVFMPIGALFMTIIWLSFVLGSYLAGLLMHKIGLTRCLMLQSAFLLLSAVVVAFGVSAGEASDYGYGKAVMAFLLPLAMGFQNSVTSQLPLERTTHWTGASTDLGIALAKGNYPFVVFTTAKIFAFILGAAIMAIFVGILNMPPYSGLLITSATLCMTAIVGDRVNKQYSSK